MVCKQRTGLEFGVRKGFEAKHTPVIKLYLGQMRPINHRHTEAMEVRSCWWQRQSGYLNIWQVKAASVISVPFPVTSSKTAPLKNMTLVSEVQKLIWKKQLELRPSPILTRRNSHSNKRAVRLLSQEQDLLHFCCCGCSFFVECGWKTWSWLCNLWFSLIIVKLSLQFRQNQPKLLKYTMQLFQYCFYCAHVHLHFVYSIFVICLAN